MRYCKKAAASFFICSNPSAYSSSGSNLTGSVFIAPSRKFAGIPQAAKRNSSSPIAFLICWKRLSRTRRVAPRARRRLARDPSVFRRRRRIATPRFERRHLRSNALTNEWDIHKHSHVLGSSSSRTLISASCSAFQISNRGSAMRARSNETELSHCPWRAGAGDFRRRLAFNKAGGACWVRAIICNQSDAIKRRGEASRRGGEKISDCRRSSASLDNGERLRKSAEVF